MLPFFPPWKRCLYCEPQWKLYLLKIPLIIYLVNVCTCSQCRLCSIPHLSQLCYGTLWTVQVLYHTTGGADLSKQFKRKSKIMASVDACLNTFKRFFLAAILMKACTSQRKQEGNILIKGGNFWGNDKREAYFYWLVKLVRIRQSWEKLTVTKY